MSAVIGQWGLSDFLGAFYRTVNNGFYFFDHTQFSNLYFGSNWSKLTVILLSLWLLGIILLIVFGLIFVAVGARGAIVSYAIHYYKTGKILSLHDAWNKGIKKFGSLLAISLLSRSVQMIELGIFAVLARSVLRFDGILSSFGVILLAALSIFLALLIEATAIYASGYALLGAKSFTQSIKKGWDLLSEHLLVSLELGLVLVLFNAFFLGAAVYGSFVAFVPSLIVWIVAGFTGLNGLIAFGMYTGMALYAAIILVLSGIFNAFVTCSWVYLLMKMHHEGVVSRTFILLKKFFRLS